MPNCDSIETFPQLLGGTCWFNALITALFYSDGMSTYLKKVIPEVHKNTKDIERKRILEVLEQLLNAREITDPKEFQKFYDILEPKNVLKYLHLKDKMFYYDPNTETGNAPETYLIMLFQFLGIKEKILFITLREGGEYYLSTVNSMIFHGEYDQKKDKYYFLGETVSGNKHPLREYFMDPKKFNYYPLSALNYDAYDLVVISDSNIIGTHYYGNLPFEPLAFDNNSLDIFGRKFIPDSLMLVNFNRNECNRAHAISGVTCKGKRYMYNGWVQRIKNSTPKSCTLFPFDWMKVKSNFCFGRNGCALTKTRKMVKEDLCFNARRKKTYIYVKESLIPKQVKNKPPCKDGKVRNPATGRCVKKLPVAKQIGVKNKPPCKDGKVRNPATGRCVKKLPVKKNNNPPNENKKKVNNENKNKVNNRTPNKNKKKIINKAPNENKNRKVNKKAKVRFPITKRYINYMTRKFKKLFF